ncbi:MAG: BTAD domain-containing putative transcriptional regulator [Actinomycetota bacterium]|nr:BTAD domain-containing putative transcriptional regulator [Actinomycetota bacterium]
MGPPFRHEHRTTSFPSVPVRSRPFPSVLARALADRALAWHGGELLPAQRSDDWAVAPRWRVTELVLRLLHELAARAAAAGEIGAAIGHLERAIVTDPHDETRYVRTARMLLSLGARRTP